MARNIKGGKVIFEVVMGGVQKARASIGKIGTAIGGIGAAIGGVSIAVAGLTAAFEVVKNIIEHVVNFIRQSIDAVMVQEKAEVLLAQTLKTTGQYSEEVYGYLRNVASQIQAASIYGDEKLLPVMASFARLGTMSADEIARATSLTADLAAATGRDLEAAQKMVFYALQGNVGMLRRAGIALDEAVLKSRNMSKIMDEIEAKVGGTAKAMADTWGGTLAQIRNWISDIKETYGRAFIADPEVRKSLNWLREAVRLLNEQINNLASSGSSISLLGKAFMGLLKIILKTADAGISFGRVMAIITRPVLTAELKTMGITWEEYYQTVVDADKAIEEIAKGMEEWEEKQDKINELTKQYLGALAAIKIAEKEGNAEQVAKFTAMAEEYRNQLAALGAAIPGEKSKIVALGNAFEQEGAQIEQTTDKIITMAEAQKLLEGHLVPIRIRPRYELEDVKIQWEAIDAAVAAATERWAENMRQLRDAALEAGAAIASAAIKGEDMGDAIQAAAAQLAGVAASVMTGMPAIGQVATALISAILGSLFGDERAMAVNFQQTIEINIGRGEIAEREFYARLFSRYIKPAMRDTGMEPGYIGGRG